MKELTPLSQADVADIVVAIARDSSLSDERDAELSLKIRLLGEGSTVLPRTPAEGRSHEAEQNIKAVVRPRTPQPLDAGETPATSPASVHSGEVARADAQGGSPTSAPAPFTTRTPAEERSHEGSTVGDLLAYGHEEQHRALTAKDREQYQFWAGWVAACQRIEGYFSRRTSDQTTPPDTSVGNDDPGYETRADPLKDEDIPF